MATLTKKLTLIFVEAGVNSNKVWYGELYDNGDVITRWGRIGKDLQSKEFSGAGESFLLKKEKEKIKKGYTPARVVDGTIGSGSISPTSVVKDQNLHEIAKRQLVKDTSNKVLNDLVTRLVRSNIHKITTSTNISFSDTTGLFSTPLGIVTPDAISEARDFLADALPYVKKSDYGVCLQKITSDYLRLIPQDIGMKFRVENIFPDVSAVEKQSDILDSLEASFQALGQKPNKAKNAKDTLEEVFKVDLDVMGNSAEFRRLVKWFEDSKKSMHSYDHIRVVNAYIVKIHDMANAFRPDNVEEVFHGTSEANCLSILKSGLKVAPPSTAKSAGKLFGEGAYGAKSSTKSLGYTYDRWHQGGVGSAGWLYICDFAMGKIHYPTVATESGPPAGYDSTWAVGGKVKYSGRTLFNDELIVYQNNRINIKYLLECK
jgi:poly [ADP-ribose] polymerase